MIKDDNRYLAAYSGNYFLVSTIIISVGSMIPFFADRMGATETEFFFLFIARSVGCLLGGSMVRLMKHFRVYPAYHTFFITMIILEVIFCFLFTYSEGKVTMAVTLAITTMLNYAQNMNINICLTLTASK